MKHPDIRWNPVIKEWFCMRCGRTSDRAKVQDAHFALDQYECQLPSVQAPRAAPGTETMKLLRKPFQMTLKKERSGCRFIVTNGDEGPEVKLELFHETSSLKGLSVGFEMLRGVTPEQAKTLVDAMNERILGVIVTPK